MAIRDEILRFVFQTEGQEGLDALAKSLANAGKEGNASGEEIKKLADDLGILLDRVKQVESLSALQEQLAKIDSEFANAKAHLEQLNASYGQTGPRTAAVTKEFIAAEQAVASLGDKHDKLAVRVATASAALSTAGVDTSNLAKAHETLSARAVETASHLASTAASAERGAISFATLKEYALRVGESLKSGGERALEFGKHLAEITGIAGLVTAALGAVTGFKFFEVGAEDASKMDAALAKLRASSGATGEQLEHLKETAEHTAEALHFDDADAVNTLTRLAESFGSVDKAAEALPGTMALAKAAQIDLAQASDITATAIKAFGLNASDASRVADALTTAAHNTGANLGALSDGFGKVAPLARKMGLDVEGTVAAMSSFTQHGLSVEQGTRTLIRLFEEIQNPTSKFKQDLVGLGITGSDFGKILDGLKASGDRGTEALQSLDAKSRPAVLALASAGSAGLNRLTDSLRQAGGAAAQAAQVIDDSLPGALKNVALDFEKLAGQAVEGTFEPIKEEAQKLDKELQKVGSTSAFQKLKDTIRDFITSAVKSFDEFIHTVDLKEWATSIGSSLKSVGENARVVGRVFGGIGDIVSGLYNVVKIVFTTIESATSTVAAGITGAISLAYRQLGIFSDDAKKKAQEWAELSNQYAENAKQQWAAGDTATEQAAKSLASLATRINETGEASKEASPKHEAHAAALEKTATSADQASEFLEKLPPSIKAQIQPFLDAAQAADKHADGIKQVSSQAEVAAAKLAASQKALIDAADDYERLNATVGTTAEQLAAARQRVVEAQRAYEAMEQAIGGLAATNTNELSPSIDALIKKFRETPPSLDDIKAAFNGLGISSQKHLDDLAESAKKNFAIVTASSDSSAKGLADQRNAFLAMAQAQLAAVKDLDQGAKDSVKYQLESKASALGLSAQLTELEKSYHGVADAVADTTKRIADNAGEMQAAAIAARKFSEAMAVLTDQNASLEERTKAAGVAIENAATSTEKQRAVAETASVAIQHQKDASTALAAAVTGMQASFNAVSEAAGQQFTQAMDRASFNAGLTKIQVQDLTHSMSALNAAAADTTGFDAYFKALAGAAETVQKELDSQRESLRAQTTAFENFASSAGASLDDLKTKIGGGTDRLFAMDQALKNGTYDAGLLGQQDLGPLQQAVSAAIAKVNALTQAEQQATQQLADLNAQLQDERDQQLGDATAIENRAYQKRIKDIEDLAAKADAAGKAQAQEELALAEQIHQKKLKDIADQAAAQKQTQQQASSNASQQSGTGSTGGNAGGASATAGAAALAPITINLPDYGTVNGLYGTQQSANDLAKLMVQALRFAKSTT